MMKKRLKHDFSIIGDDIHQLRSISKDEDWSDEAWRIHEVDNLYWVPVKKSKPKPITIDPECPKCKRRWYSYASNL